MDEERPSFDVDDTLKSNIRDPKWRLKEDREKLRQEIVYDMLTKKRFPTRWNASMRVQLIFGNK